MRMAYGDGNGRHHQLDPRGVALKYEQGKMDAPVVLAKGYDEIAQKIKAIAAEHGIPMVENVSLARALARKA